MENTDRAETVHPWLTKQKSHEIFRFHCIFWCSKAIQIRTISLGCNFCRFSKGDGLCSFFIIKSYQNLIIIQINRIDKRIHQRLPLVFQAGSYPACGSEAAKSGRTPLSSSAWPAVPLQCGLAVLFADLPELPAVPR